MSEKRSSESAKQEVTDWSGLDDESLGIAAQNGSREARNALYMRKREQIGRLAGRARRYLNAISWAYSEPPLTYEDIDQQAFIVFCDLLDEWTPGEQTVAVAVIRRIPGRLIHCVRDTARPERNAARGESYSDAEEQVAKLPTKSADLPSDWEEYTKDLPYRLRVAVTLRYWEDLPASRIADVQGRSKRTVNRDLRRARRLIREKIEDEGGEQTRGSGGARWPDLREGRKGSA